MRHIFAIFTLPTRLYPNPLWKTRGACQLHRGGQSRSPVRPLCNRKRFSCLPPQAKMSWILYAISMRLSDRRIASCSRWFCARSGWQSEYGENRPRDRCFYLLCAGCAVSAGKGEVCAPEIGAVCGSGKVRNMIKAKNASRYYNALSSLIWNCKTARGGLKNRLHRAVYIVF